MNPFALEKETPSIARDGFESRIEAFERAWQRGTPPDFSAYLSLPDEEEETSWTRFALLTELIKVDLEFRWRGAKRHRFLEDYAHRFPELTEKSPLDLGLIAEEYRARRRWGDQPDHAGYLQRFPGRERDVVASLTRIDGELHAEWGTEPTQTRNQTFATGSGPNPSRQVDSQGKLAYHDYLLEKMLGAGGMGKVYQALQMEPRRRVAIKYLKKAYQNHPRVIERFLEEAKIVARLRHPGIVQVHGLGRTPRGGYFIAMDLIRGRDVARILEAGEIPFRDAIRWVAEAAEAIAFANQQGIVHCDLKPSNLLVSENRRVFVTDFGLARPLHSKVASPEAVAGTAPFMAPEQVDSSRGPISARTDVYGLGAVLYTLLTGHPPYRGSVPSVLSNIIGNEEIVAPELHGEAIDSEIVEVWKKCCEKEPANRYHTAEQVANALRTILR